MTVLLTFGLAAAATYALRSCMIMFGGRYTDSPRFASAAALVGPAVLAAIVASALFLDDGQLQHLNPVEVAAVIAGALAVRRTKNVGAAMLAGLSVYWAGSLLPFV